MNDLLAKLAAENKALRESKEATLVVESVIAPAGSIQKVEFTESDGSKTKGYRLAKVAQADRMNQNHRVIGSKHGDGSDSLIEEIVFDGCSGNVELRGTPGSIRRCYINRLAGSYEQVPSTVDGVDRVVPEACFIRGLPLDLVSTSPAPEALPLVYPEEANVAIAIGWRLKSAVVLIEVPPAVECGAASEGYLCDRSPEACFAS
ncbi:MAG: hypothetical protein ACM359_07950 [Bacillota bacterium]